jgi:hypothetical protein
MNDTRITASPIWDFVRLCAVVFIWALLVAAVIKPTTARSHDMQGHFSEKPYSTPDKWLYGKRIGATPEMSGLINCCTFGGNGDCQEIHRSRVEDLGEDGAIFDGEHIAAKDLTLSPDGKLYLCKHPGRPAHCAFITKAGG